MSRIESISSVKWGFPFSGPNTKEPSKLLCQVTLNHEIVSGMIFHDCLVNIAHAHRNYGDENRYICYGTWAGPGFVWLLYPLQDMKDMDKLLLDQKALMETVDDKNNNYTKAVDDLKATLISQEKHILKYDEELSNIRTSVGDAPSDYIYYIEVQIKKSVEKEHLKKCVKEFIEVNNYVDKGHNWVTYTGDSDDKYQMHIFVPARTFSEIDEWKSIKSIFEEYEKSKGVNTNGRGELYSNIVGIRTHLMTFVPSCDNSGFEFSK